MTQQQAREALLSELKFHLGMQAADHRVDLYLSLYLTDKKNNVLDAYKKLLRRISFEKTLTKIQITEVMVRELKSGKMNIIGWDYKKRPVFLVSTAHNHPKKETREDEQKNFILAMEYLQTFYREDVHQAVFVVDRQRASLWGNTDLNFERDMARLLSKYYPQQVALILLVNQHWSINRAVQPFLTVAPPTFKGKIHSISQSELWKHINIDILPASLGGRNNLNDYPPEEFGDRVLRHWYALSERIHKGERPWVRPVQQDTSVATPKMTAPMVYHHGALSGQKTEEAIPDTSDEESDDGMQSPMGSENNHNRSFPAATPVVKGLDAELAASDSDDERTQDFSEPESHYTGMINGACYRATGEVISLRAHLDETEKKVRLLEDQLRKVQEQSRGTVPNNDDQFANSDLCRTLKLFHEQSNVLVNEVVHEYAASSELSTAYLLRQTRQSFGRIIQVRGENPQQDTSSRDPMPLEVFDAHSVVRDSATAHNGCCVIS